MNIVTICGDPDEDMSEARFVGHISVKTLVTFREETEMISELALVNLFGLACGTCTPSPDMPISTYQLDRIASALETYRPFIEAVLA